MRKDWIVVANQEYTHVGGFRFEYNSIEEALDAAAFIANSLYKDGVTENHVFVVKRNAMYPMDEVSCTVYYHYSILHENGDKELILYKSWSNNPRIIHVGKVE